MDAVDCTESLRGNKPDTPRHITHATIPTSMHRHLADIVHIRQTDSEPAALSVWVTTRFSDSTSDTETLTNITLVSV